MTNYLPSHATTPEACEWLATETGEPWTLTRLLENSLTPWVWLDYETRFPEIFGDRLEGFITPMLFHGDVVRLAGGGDGVLLTMIRTPDKGIARMMPGYRAGIDDLRFLRDDITRLAGKHSAPHGTLAAKEAAHDAKSSNGKPPLQQQFQEQEILRVIGELSYEPKNLPQPKPGKSGVKAEVRKRLSFQVKVFDKAWERLKANVDIQYAD